MDGIYWEFSFCLHIPGFNINHHADFHIYMLQR